MSNTNFIGAFEKALNIEPRPTYATINIAFHLVIAMLVLIGFVCAAMLMYNTLYTPDALTGWMGHRDYDADKIKRLPLTTYVKTNPTITDDTPMIKFAVATACFGGIFTENITALNPWIGNVHPDAARRQVEAGARALLLDIWPDPNTRAPIVCSMEDSQEWGRFWFNNGLNKRVGRYSNWKKLTRNTAPVKSIVNAAITAAFDEDSPQKSDPFFLILHLHGTMTTAYLNNLGKLIKTELKGRGMSTSGYTQQQRPDFTALKYTQCLDRICVIVIPDIQTTYTILPNINTYSEFKEAFLPTTLGELTNVLEEDTKTMMFEPADKAMISAPNVRACPTGGAKKSLSQTGFCIIRPSTGGRTTRNTDFYETDSFTDCLQTGAQFVAVNLFSRDDNDSVLQTFFDDNYFGKYSFVKLK